MAGGPSNRAMVMVNPSPAGMSENGQEPADDIVYTPEVPQKADPIAAVRRMEKVCHKRNRAFTDHRAAGGFLASLAPAVAANHSDESPAAVANDNIREELVEIEAEPRTRLVREPAHRPMIARDDHPQCADAGLFRPSPTGCEQIRANTLPAPVRGYRERRLGDPVTARLEYLNHADDPTLGEGPRQ